MAEYMEGSHAPLVAALHLAVDQAGAHLEVVHCRHHQREAGGPVVSPARDQPDADRVSPGHEPVAVVLDLVNPVGPRGWTVGGGRETGLDKLGLGGKPLTHTLDQH